MLIINGPQMFECESNFKSLYVIPIMNWRFFQGIPHLLPNVSWDRPQLWFILHGPKCRITRSKMHSSCSSEADAKVKTKNQDHITDIVLPKLHDFVKKHNQGTSSPLTFGLAVSLQCLPSNSGSIRCKTHKPSHCNMLRMRAIRKSSVHAVLQDNRETLLKPCVMLDSWPVLCCTFTPAGW